jgi:hypothetical protein
MSLSLRATSILQIRCLLAPVYRSGILARMPKKKESEFDELARLIKEEGEDDIRGEISEARADVGNLSAEFGGLRKEMHDGFAAINRRLDHIIQTQLDEHARRLKKLETAVFQNKLSWAHPLATARSQARGERAGIFGRLPAT